MQDIDLSSSTAGNYGGEIIIILRDLPPTTVNVSVIMASLKQTMSGREGSDDL